MRSVIEKSDDKQIEIWFSEPAEVADTMNDRFHHAQVGRPVDPDDLDGQVQALVTRRDGNEDVTGGAVAARSADLDARLAAAGAEAAVGRVHVLKIVFVDSPMRHRGYGRALVEAVKGKAQQLGAEHLIADVNSADALTLRWFQKLGFTICNENVDLVVDGVVLPVESGKVFVWISLTRQQTVTVSYAQG